MKKLILLGLVIALVFSTVSVGFAKTTSISTETLKVAIELLLANSEFGVVESTTAVTNPKIKEKDLYIVYGFNSKEINDGYTYIIYNGVMIYWVKLSMSDIWLVMTTFDELEENYEIEDGKLFVLGGTEFLELLK